MLRQALQVLIDEQLLQGQLKESNVEISDQQLDEAIADVKTRNGIRDDETFVKALAHENLTMEAYRRQLRRQLEKQKLLNTKVRGQVKVGDDDLKAEYERTYVQVTGEQEVHARHILLQLKRDASAAEDSALRQRAQEITQRLRAGADFAKLARELSDGPSASQGGDLGYFRRGVMVAEFEKVAFSLPIGAVSDPVRTQFGWHVIQVIDRRKAPPPPFDTVKEELRQKLQRDQADRLTQDYLASLRKDAAIDIKIDSLKPQGPAPSP
jgi:peptidyl-prolyl cis-trans isomerase SurA